METIWVTYKVHYGGGHQLDPNPNTYSEIAMFTDELSALRHANAHGAKVTQLPFGRSLNFHLAPRQR